MLGLTKLRSVSLMTSGLRSIRPVSTPDAFVRERGDIDISLFSDGDGVRLAHAEAIWPLYVDALGVDGLDEGWGADLGTHAMLRGHLRPELLHVRS
jgi:hypothetical protein